MERRILNLESRTFLPTASGSLGDADTLDGQHGSYYRDAGNINAGTLGLAYIPTPLTGKDADSVDGAHGYTTPTANSLLVLDASGYFPDITINDRINIASQIQLGASILMGFYTKTVTDNVATGVFTITTTNESGSNDGGVWSCFVQSNISHVASPTATDSAAKGHLCSFAHASKADGTSVNSAVTEIAETASAATTPATRDIGTVTCTLTATSNYITTVNYTVDGTGSSVSTLRVAAWVMLIWRGYSTEPILATA